MKRLLALSILACLSAAVNADEVQFTNGDRLSGKVLGLSDGKLSFDSKLAGKLEIAWSGLASRGAGRSALRGADRSPRRRSRSRMP